MSAEKTSLISEEERQRLTADRDRIREEFLVPTEHRPPSTGKGIHHTALVCRDVRTTVEWYQNVAGFPVTVLFENRDLAGSTHFFFDVGNGNNLAFFDLPGVDPSPYAEVLGGLHHIAISVPGSQWYGIKRSPRRARDRLHGRVRACRSTRTTPTAPASSSSWTRSARCTARTRSSPA